jgi:alkyl sulfatase BDS1-like metallo-beta-lactamase superfamily hydrolase
MRALTLDQLLDSLAIRVDGPRAWHADLAIRFRVRDAEPIDLRLRNGVLIHTTGPAPAGRAPDTEITLTESDLRALLLGTADLTHLADQGSAEISGDPGTFAELLGYLADPDPDFAIVTP